MPEQQQQQQAIDLTTLPVAHKPVAPRGWQIWRHYYDGRAPEPDTALTPAGRSLAYCRRWARYQAENDQRGLCEFSVEPVGGWASINTDPVAAIVYHVAHGDLDPEVATARLKGLLGGADTWPEQLRGWVLDEEGEEAPANVFDDDYLPF